VPSKGGAGFLFIADRYFRSASSIGVTGSINGQHTAPQRYIAIIT
jgi:hypothetical protein